MRSLCFFTFFALVCACSDDPASLAIRSGDSLAVRVEFQNEPESTVALELARADLEVALRRVAGLSDDAPRTSGARILLVTGANLESDSDEAYRITRDDGGLRVDAATEKGAAYALYQIAGDLGTEYIHPEQTVHPAGDPAAMLREYTGELESPRFRRRGFHEHTQHPIPASDFFLRADSGDANLNYQAYAENYLRWIFRNRQNVASFHMLRTVDLDSWTPYVQGLNRYADSLFIETGMVIGFVDEQQNAYKTYRPESDNRPAAEQIPERITAILNGGFDFLTFQIGASEFTTPTDNEVLSYLDIALTHIQAAHPDVTMGTWIHITCDLEAEGGGDFFHLPLMASEDIRAWLHTTMFYTLEHPAPVYDCENFHHQRNFYNEVRSQDRELEFFPETAWWLGFDNNVPLELPIYGWSRDWDIFEELDERTTGHVTFTTGREWGYWRYDHYLTKVTWDGQTRWNDYLRGDVAELFGGGADGTAVAEALVAMGDLQVRHFYEENPELYFYVAGELPQDEVGERAGVLARRPKPSFTSILNLGDAEFAAWQSNALGTLRTMRDEYAAITEALPEVTGDSPQELLRREAIDGMVIFTERIAHAIALYEGVAALRPWWRGEAQESQRDAIEAEAQAAVTRARAIEDNVTTRVQREESHYRYPLSMLARPKPDSLTIYPIGYLRETSTRFFWTRRTSQLNTLIPLVFDASGEAWSEPAPDLTFIAPQRRLQVVVPSGALVQSALGGLLPSFLFGLNSAEATGMNFAVRFAQDANGNQKPDADTEASFPGTRTGNEWISEMGSYSILVPGDEGPIATLSVVDFVITLSMEGAAIRQGRLRGNLLSAEVVSTIGTVTGTDPESAANFIKQAYEIPPEDPLPEELPFELLLAVEAAL